MIRQKGHSFINIIGLAIGLASCLLITLWILDELSYDKFHKDSQQIYHILAHGTVKNNPVTPSPLAPALEDEVPEVVHATRYEGMLEVLLSHKEKEFYEDDLRAVDPCFFKIFTFPFLKGNPDTALKDVNSIVITESIAEKYFGSENPIGKVLTMNNQRELTVTGVIKNVPHNSTLRFDILVPHEIRRINMKQQGWEMNWGTFSSQTFIKLRPDCSPGDMNQKIANFIQKHEEKEHAVLSILPFTQRNLFFTGKERNIYIFSVIAFFILLIACINFMNLSTARSANRAREIGIRKVTGAYRRSIILQFLSESLLLSLIALIVAFILVAQLIPVFNAIIGVKISPGILHSPAVLLVLIGLVLFTGIAAGSYPALFLSAFQPIRVLKGNLESGAKRGILRKSLVVIQFSLSIFLIIGTVFVYKQLNYIKNRDIGYDRQHIVNVSLKGESQKFYQVLKNKLLGDKRIVSVTGTMDDLPYFGWSSGTGDWEGKDPNKEVLTYNNVVDYDFPETLKIEMVEGRSFSRKFTSDAGVSYLINEEMAKLMGVKSAVGARLTYWRKPGKIIGVMKNFNFLPLDTKINPFVLILDPEKIQNMVIRIQPENISSSLGFIKDTWEKTVTNYPFEYTFLDERFDRSYRGIERVGNLLNSFAVLAVFIACLGLFGLASFMAEQRTREIGIRKVLGAPVSGIVFMLSKEFTRCVLVANIFAWPVAYWALSKWLENFAYRTNIGFLTFILSGLIALIIALLTVSYKSIKAAKTDPVHALKYE
jgi:ABC-type antimicrobial peptide transport system permease subunit